MTQLLMPKATAVWLIDNTALSFDQIADFCSLHPLEVQSIADGETGIGIQGYDPVQNGQLTREVITQCETDPTGRLTLAESNLPTPNRRTKGPRYVPVARRGDKPDGIAWLVKHHPELKDSQIVKLIGTTLVLPLACLGVWCCRRRWRRAAAATEAKEEARAIRRESWWWESL